MGIELAALGALASAGGAGAAAGGALSTLATVGTVVSGVGSLVGGVSSFMESKEQAKLAQQQAETQARAEARSNIALESQQKVAFLNSGVSLQGSPLMVLQETERKGEENVGAIIQSGQTQAASLRSSGRSALIGGIGSAGSSFASLGSSK